MEKHNTGWDITPGQFVGQDRWRTTYLPRENPQNHPGHYPVSAPGFRVQPPYMEQQNQMLDEINRGLQTQRDALAGKLPSAFEANYNKSINRSLNQSMGSSLNNLASRGVINSSSFGSASKGMSEAAANQANQNYMNALQFQMSNAMQPFTSRMGAASSFYNYGNQQEQQLLNLYNLWRQSRYGVQGDTAVTQDSNGMMGLLPFALMGGK